MDLRGKIIQAIEEEFSRPIVGPSLRSANRILAIPEIKEALAAKVELDALKLALLQSHLGGKEIVDPVFPPHD